MIKMLPITIIVAFIFIMLAAMLSSGVSIYAAYETKTAAAFNLLLIDIFISVIIMLLCMTILVFQL